MELAVRTPDFKFDHGQQIVVYLASNQDETPAKLRHSGGSRNPEGLGNRGPDYQCVGLTRWRGVLQGSHQDG